MVANLPYYITTPIIMGLFENHIPAESITVMVQKEAAERLCATVGSRESGAVTVAVNYYANAKILFDVDRYSFMPPPNVDSAVIQLEIREKPAVELKDEKLFFQCIKAGFGQRRKTLSNSLMGLGDVTKEQVKACLENLGIEEKRRAETLSLEEFANVANYFSKGEK